MEKTIEQLTFPRVSDEHDESLVTFWHKSVGDYVEKGEIIVEVQTEKAVSEIPAEHSGYLTEIFIKRGEVASVGDRLASIEIETTMETENSIQIEKEKVKKPSSEDESKVEEKQSIKAPPRVRKLAKELGIDLLNVIGSGPNGIPTVEDVTAAAEQQQVVEKAPPETTKRENRAIASPAVRKAAREKGMSLDEIIGSGKNGRIMLEDLEPSKEVSEAPQAEAKVEQERNLETSPFPREEEVEIEKLIGVRKAISSAMVKSVQTIPQVTHFEEVDITSLVSHQKRFKQMVLEQSVKLTFLPYIIKAFVHVLQEYRELNASVIEDKDEIHYKQFYNIGFAVQTDHGLLVPVIKQANKKSIFQLAQAIETLTTHAKDNKLTKQDIENGTSTISNIGSAGGHWFTPIIRHPESAILGIGQIEEKPIIKHGEYSKGHMLSLSLTYDHRIIDGVIAQHALNRFKQLIKDPELLLLLGN